MGKTSILHQFGMETTMAPKFVRDLKERQQRAVIAQLPVMIFEEHTDGFKPSVCNKNGALSLETMDTLHCLHIVLPSPSQIVVVRDLAKASKGRT